MDWIGVDGCRGGWIAAGVEHKRVQWRVFTTFKQIQRAFPKTVIAVDTPIGLAAAGEQRPADLAAKAWLAEHHGQRSSVFLSPDVTHLESWRGDTAHPLGRGISIQAWNILDKIADVADRGIEPGDRWVVEAHPEISFRAIPGSQVTASKKSAEGTQQRLDALRSLGWKLPHVQVPARGIFEDALDAAALAWTAKRHAAGKSETLPKTPSKKHPGVITV